MSNLDEDTHLDGVGAVVGQGVRKRVAGVGEVGHRFVHLPIARVPEHAAGTESGRAAGLVDPAVAGALLGGVAGADLLGQVGGLGVALVVPELDYVEQDLKRIKKQRRAFGNGYPGQTLKVPRKDLLSILHTSAFPLVLDIGPAPGHQSLYT